MHAKLVAADPLPITDEAAFGSTRTSRYHLKHFTPSRCRLRGRLGCREQARPLSRPPVTRDMGKLNHLRILSGCRRAKQRACHAAGTAQRRRRDRDHACQARFTELRAHRGEEPCPEPVGRPGVRAQPGSRNGCLSAQLHGPYLAGPGRQFDGCRQPVTMVRVGVLFVLAGPVQVVDEPGGSSAAQDLSDHGSALRSSSAAAGCPVPRVPRRRPLVFCPRAAGLGGGVRQGRSVPPEKQAVPGGGRTIWSQASLLAATKKEERHDRPGPRPAGRRVRPKSAQLAWV